MRMKTIASCMALVLAGGCKSLDIPDYYAGDLGELAGGNATVATVVTAVQGLTIGLRSITTSGVSTMGEIGREGYSLDPANPANNIQRLQILSPGGFSSWSTTYSNLRQASVILKALGPVTGLTEAEKEGIRGFAKTLMAIDLLWTINQTDVSGAAIDYDRGVNDELAPVVDKATVFNKINQLFDEGKAHLQAGGATFAFRLPVGFTGFNTPATFLTFNRAMKARVDAYERNWTAALTDLGESFISSTGTPANMAVGVYNSFSTASGESTNGLFDPLPRTLVAHQSTIADAQPRAGGQPDLRATSKTAAIATRITNSIQVDLKWVLYPAADSPHPIIKNEELLLLRAEANLACTGMAPTPNCTANPVARAAALADVNIVRVNSGGLDPIAVDPGTGGSLTGDQLLDEILYNRRYSLLWEGGHRWIDWRRYGILDKLPPYKVGHVVFPYSPLPQAECMARDPQPAGCTLPTLVVPTVPPTVP